MKRTQRILASPRFILSRTILCLLFCSLITLSACSANTASEHEALDTLAAESEMTITSSDTQVAVFTAKNKDFITEYEADECYNITPGFIADNSDYAVFKYSKSTQSFIMYDDEVYSIGVCFGGFGITSMALADLDGDGGYELYYTFSWGSGLHRSQIGYFNPADKEIHVFDYSLPGSDMMLTVNQSGVLCVNSATLNGDSFVDFTVKAQDFIGTVDIEGNGTQDTVNIISDMKGGTVDLFLFGPSGKEQVFSLPPASGK